MSIKQITNEFRTKVIEKLQMLNPMMLRNSTPEAIESACFDKAENNIDSYLKLCQIVLSNNQKQVNAEVTTNNLSSMQHLRPNITGQSNSGTSSDPINALQNLTVTAGQPNQMNMQQTNPQQQMSIRMNTNMFNQQMRQRSMMPVTLQSGNMQRPMEQFPMSQSPMTQILQPQMQQVHNINPINIINTSNVRLTKNVVPQSPTMSMAYQIDPNNGGQQIQNIVRPQMVRMISNSPSNVNQQVSIIQTMSQDQYSTPKPIQVTSMSNLSQEESNSQPPSNSQPNTIANNSSNQNISNNSINPNVPPNIPVKPVISEEEALKVKEELLSLSGRYLRYIKLVLKHPEHILEQNKKVWVTLAGVLDDPNGLNKNISLKHVIKIQDFCERAEKIVQNHNLDDVKPIKDITVPKSEEIFGKRVIPDRNRPVSSNIDPCSITGAATNNVNNSLDAAFDDVIHQLKKKDPKTIRKIQKNLVEFVKKNLPQSLHFLPRNLQNRDDDNSDEFSKVEPHYNEHEFDYLDDIVIEGFERPPLKGRNRALDHAGMLRIDIDPSLLSSSEFSGLQSELELVHGDFHVELLDEQSYSSKWCTKDDIWEKSSFYSFTLRNENFPNSIPPIYLRVPFDYDQGGSVDWNLNEDLYSPVTNNNNNNNSFLSDIRCAIEDEFADLNGQFSEVNLLHALSVYKRSIETGYSNFECRRAMSLE